MNKQFTKALALGLAAMMVLGGCGGASTETKAPEETSAEKPQQQQEQSEPGSISYLSAPAEIAPTGHSASHAPQLMQSLLIL